MDSEFPSNSNMGKQAPREKEKITKVTTGEVVTRKKPLGKRFRETFFQADAKNVGSFVFLDVFIPATKNLIEDIIIQGVERTLHGELRSRSSGTRGALFDNAHIAYNRMSGSSSRQRREEPRGLSRQGRSSHNFDEILLASRAEGVEVVRRLDDLIQRYDVVSVADLYAIVGVEGTFIDEKWGWTDLRDADIVRTRGGAYLLDLPRPEPIN